MMLNSVSDGIRMPMSSMPGKRAGHAYARPMASATSHFVEAVAVGRPVLVAPEQVHQVMEADMAADLPAGRNQPIALPLMAAAHGPALLGGGSGRLALAKGEPTARLAGVARAWARRGGEEAGPMSWLSDPHDLLVRPMTWLSCTGGGTARGAAVRRAHRDQPAGRAGAAPRPALRGSGAAP